MILFNLIFIQPRTTWARVTSPTVGWAFPLNPSSRKCVILAHLMGASSQLWFSLPQMIPVCAKPTKSQLAQIIRHLPLIPANCKAGGEDLAQQLILLLNIFKMQMKTLSYWLSLPLSSKEEMGSCPAAAAHVSEWRSIVVSPFGAQMPSFLRLVLVHGSLAPCWISVSWILPQMLVGLVGNLAL